MNILLNHESIEHILRNRIFPVHCCQHVPSYRLYIWTANFILCAWRYLPSLTTLKYFFSLITEEKRMFQAIYLFPGNIPYACHKPYFFTRRSQWIIEPQSSNYKKFLHSSFYKWSICSLKRWHYFHKVIKQINSRANPSLLVLRHLTKYS